MKNIIFLIATAVGLAACSHEEAEMTKQDQNPAFNAYKQNFIPRLWKLHPVWAGSQGYHAYDSLLPVPDATRKKEERDFILANMDSLKRFDDQALSDYNKTDYYLLRDYFNASLWGMDTLKEDEWNPAAYNICGVFSEMLANDYDNIDTRLRNFEKRTAHVAAYYNSAKKRIKNPTKEHTELAISQNEGGMSVFDIELKAALAKSGLNAEEKNRISSNAAKAANAVKDYVSFLKTLADPEPRSFRLGKTLYHSKFRHDLQSGFSAEEIFNKAITHKQSLHKKMYGITSELWPKYFGNKIMPGDSLLAIRQMIDKISEDHVKPENFQQSIEAQIPELVKFVNRKHLLYLDSTKPLVVRKEPAYMAGMAGASISSPGPYDIKGNTYYNVGSMNGWSKERSESYLREYNRYILQILNIHEAIPGHYTQLIYSNQSAAGNDNDKVKYPLPGIIKSVFGNGAMVEGWAVYSELMMLENGYGAEKGHTTADPVMWLMYYKWNLRSTCNTILDYSTQVNNMSKEEAIDLLTREAFQQKAEAEGKWRRATLSQVQLCSYFTGFSEIVSLRKEVMEKMGDRFDLKKFHEKFLSYGSAPVKYIRQMMLAEL